MKAISSALFKMLLSLTLLFLLLVVGMGWLGSVGAIDWEEAWEIGPESGRPTEPEWGEGGTASFDVLDNLAERIFTSAPNAYDLSEIGCLIAEDIYKDFKKYGVEVARPVVSVKGIPFTGYPEYLGGEDWSIGGTGHFINEKSFLYARGPGSTNAADEAEFANEGYPDCHLCMDGGSAITHLDETCINMNLRDRTVGTSYFCHGPTGPPPSVGDDGDFIADSGKPAQFGNCIGPNIFGNDVGNWYDYQDGWIQFGTGAWFDCPNQDANDICDNDREMIKWSPNYHKIDADWPAGDKWKVKDTTETHEDMELSDDWNYMYGVFWIPEYSRYDVVFAMYPETPVVGLTYTATDWTDIWEDIFDDNLEWHRTNALGYKYWQMRIAADYLVEPNAGDDVNIHQVIVDKIASVSEVDKDDINCLPCDRWADCWQIPVPIEKQCKVDAFREEPIRMRTNATNSAGVRITSCNEDLIGGRTYRVIITNWWGKFVECQGTFCPNIGGWYDCYTNYDRQVIILEL